MDGDFDGNGVSLAYSDIIFSNFAGEGTDNILFFLLEEDIEHGVTEGRGDGTSGGEVIFIIWHYVEPLIMALLSNWMGKLSSMKG
jgi:hypothetical protein